MVNPFLPMPDTNDDIAKSYALLGRALAYATEFEENCRKLAHLSEVENTNGEFSYEVYLLITKGTLFQKIEKFVQCYELPGHSEETIHSARKARNNIAHKVAIDHRELVQTDSGRREFRANILMEMDALISGNLFVLDIMRIIENGRVDIHGSDMMSYSLAVFEWIDG